MYFWLFIIPNIPFGYRIYSMSRPKLNSFLVIDDEEANEFITKIFLQRANCAEKIMSVRDARDGLLVLENDEIPEIIFLDINMPGMNAWRFLEEAKTALGHNRFPFIVILSSSINMEDQAAADEHPNIQMFVSKPINPEKVNEILDQYFATYHEN